MADVVDGAGPTGLTRRDALKRGAIVGGALVWTVPAVQILAMNHNAAEAASGGTPPGNNPNPPGNPITPDNPNPPDNPPAAPHDVQPSVQGIDFEQPPPPAVKPTATLPFTGAAVPVTGAVALGAGLVATGVAAVAASHRRQQTAAAGAHAADVSADDEAAPPTN